LSRAALQTIDGDHDGGPLEYFYEPVQQVFMIVGSWLVAFGKIYSESLRRMGSWETLFFALLFSCRLSAFDHLEKAIPADADVPIDI
jgi:hypothetical protein